MIDRQPLVELVDELERVAESLRSEDLSGSSAATAVERCCQLAGDLINQTDRLMRVDSFAATAGQGELL